MSDDLKFWMTKAKVTGDLGETLDAKHHEAIQAANMTRGMAMGLRAGADHVRNLHKHIDALLEEGKIPEGASDVEVASLLKSWITKAVTALENASEAKALEATGVSGRAQGLRDALAMLQSHHTTAVARATQLATPAAEPEAVERKREDGERPAPSALDARRGGDA